MTRNRRTLSILGQTLLASAMGSAVAFAQAPIVLPLSYPALQQFKNSPEVWTQPAPSVPAAGPAVAGPWQTTNNAYPGAATPGNPLLMTDGTVIVHQISNDTSLGRNWYRLTPDINGSYVNGTWSSAGLLPAGYGPLFHASEVLPDGRVVSTAENTISSHRPTPPWARSTTRASGRGQTSRRRPIGRKSVTRRASC